MKKLIITACLILPALIACTDPSENDTNEVTGVVLSKDKVDLLVGESVTITASVMPESLGMGVVWSVLDPQYAEVKDGTVTGKSEGVTYVIATSADGSMKAACMVSVNPQVAYSVSIKDIMGQPLSAIYGYPGMTMKLSAYSSDGSTHTYTWSVEDAAAASITSAGVLTLGTLASTDASLVYDAQTFVKVVSEEGYGCKIPLRSSLLRGVTLGEIFEPAGTPIIVQKDETYSLALMYQGEGAPLPVPADGATLELTNTTDFTVKKVAGAWSLITGSVTGVSSKLNVSVAGSAEKVEIAEFKIDKIFPIKAQFIGGSSSTLSFTWTEGVSDDDDVSKPYTAALYKDEACTDLEISYSIPADDGCWKGKQPRFVFSGLNPGTDYWFKVTDASTSGADLKESAAIPATTDAFNCVMVSEDPASVGDIILAEDFGQMCWGADELTQAAGFDVADDGVAYNSDTKKSFTYREADHFVAYTTQYAQRSLTAQTVAKKEEGVRFAHWAQGQYARIYIGPGYLFLSTTSYGTHIITPELTSIPEGKTAKLKVTIHASGKVSGGEAVFAVQHNKTFNEISSNTQTNKNKLDLSSNIQTITFNGGITNLEEFEVTIEGVVKGDRIAFGPTSETVKDNSNMMLFSDMTIEIIELN